MKYFLLIKSINKIIKSRLNNFVNIEGSYISFKS